MNKTRKVPSLAARQLLHVVVAGGVDPLYRWAPKGRSLLGQHLDPHPQRCLLLDRQALPPLDELVGDLHLPHPGTLPLVHDESRLMMCRIDLPRARGHGRKTCWAGGRRGGKD